MTERWLAENHGNTKHVGNVTLTAGYKPITSIFSDRLATVTQPITFSALRKFRRAGDFLIVGRLSTTYQNTSEPNGEFCSFLPTDPETPLRRLPGRAGAGGACSTWCTA